MKIVDDDDDDDDSCNFPIEKFLFVNVFLTSAQKVMFYWAFLCLSVCLSASPFLCYQLCVKTADGIFMKILLQKSLWTRKSL